VSNLTILSTLSKSDRPTISLKLSLFMGVGIKKGEFRSVR